MNELERSLRTELEADALVQLTDSGADATLVAEVGCDTALSTSIRLMAVRSQRHSERTIVLADANPSARAGVLALAAAELVRSDLSRLTSADSRVDYPSEPGATAGPAAESGQSAPTRAAAESPAAAKHEPSQPAVAAHDAAEPAANRDRSPSASRRRWQVAADARLRWFPDYASVSWGAAAGADFSAWRVRAEGLLAAPKDALGSASVGSAAACVGYRLLDQRLGAVEVALYPQLAAGVTWLRGSAAQTEVKVSPATGFYGDARLVTEARFETAAVSPTLALELGRGTGYVARSAGRAVGATGGFFIGANAGATY